MVAQLLARVIREATGQECHQEVSVGPLGFAHTERCLRSQMRNPLRFFGQRRCPTSKYLARKSAETLRGGMIECQHDSIRTAFRCAPLENHLPA